MKIDLHIPTTAPGALSIEDFCTWASIGRSLTYKLIKDGVLRPIKVGRRTLIPMSEATRWLESLRGRDTLTHENGGARDVRS